MARRSLASSTGLSPYPNLWRFARANGKVMAWMMDTYSMNHGTTVTGVVNRVKPLSQSLAVRSG
ncbi:hypothetical protein R3X43_28745, partial [Salmonella enterica subsp. enterica serovar Typhimurium]|uniref:hypothetical protein n=1 Tax=Salmonella enterica TaxID=28901 RepID=UPI002A763ED4